MPGHLAEVQKRGHNRYDRAANYQLVMELRANYNHAALVILVPAYQGIRWETAQALEGACRHLKAEGVGDVRVLYLGQTLLPDCREELARQALAASPAFVLWVDADMDFQPELPYRLLAWAHHHFETVTVNPTTTAGPGGGLLERLLERTLFVAGVPYPRRGWIPDLAIYPLPGQGPRWLDQVEKAEPVQVGGVGFGFAIMPGAALAAIAEPRFHRPFFGGGYLGEDLAFCQDLRARGGEAWAHFGLGPLMHLVTQRRDLTWYDANARPQADLHERRRKAFGDDRPGLEHEQGGLVIPGPASGDYTPEEKRMFKEVIEEIDRRRRRPPGGPTGEQGEV